MPNRTPDLLFGPGSNVGFTPTGIAAFDDLRPAAVVRELIQNALDAARTAGVAPAVVRFRISRVSGDSIPGIESYRRAFEKAIATQTELSGGVLASQAQLVVNRIQEALNRKYLDVLTVLDNGVGLDKTRMNALLSDGVSVKGKDAMGTYGNGHATAIPASDLRYVLYGGVTRHGGRIGAGHAVLASCREEGVQHPRSGDGFYIRDFSDGRYDCATDDDLPDLITNTLEHIEADTPHGDTPHGTSVIIPAFNNFLEDDRPLWEMVSHAASANFFIAIEDGDLEVTVEDHRFGPGGRHGVLDKSSLGEVLNNHRDKQRAKAFLNGRRAAEAYQTYRSGVPRRICTKAGEVEIRMRDSEDGVTRIDLCRNGMWITDGSGIPGFWQKFTNQEPFRAILSLNDREGGKLHEDIRTAEGPLHDKISLKDLPLTSRKRCREALLEIVEWIKRNTRSFESDNYVSPDFLTLDFGGGSGEGAGKARKGFWGVPKPITRVSAHRLPLFPTDQDPEEGDGGLKNGEPSPPDSKKKTDTPPGGDRRRRPSLPIVFQAASRPAGENRRRIMIECGENFKNAELRLVVDEALDATCERHSQDAYMPAVLSNVMIDGRAAGDADLIRWDVGVVGVRLGNLRTNTSLEVETDYQLTGDFANLSSPSLRVEIFRSEQQAPVDSK